MHTLDYMWIKSENPPLLYVVESVVVRVVVTGVVIIATMPVVVHYQQT